MEGGAQALRETSQRVYHHTRVSHHARVRRSPARGRLRHLGHGPVPKSDLHDPRRAPGRRIRRPERSDRHRRPREARHRLRHRERGMHPGDTGVRGREGVPAPARVRGLPQPLRRRRALHPDALPFVSGSRRSHVRRRASRAAREVVHATRDEQGDDAGSRQGPARQTHEAHEGAEEAAQGGDGTPRGSEPQRRRRTRRGPRV
mmetsp:Transcript_9238/g.37287  ORF Transcript_9238/g.37287 Transcript_9238/m.37287 type:complete len:203 (+) Transcript_9238:332-940(+)